MRDGLVVLGFPRRGQLRLEVGDAVLERRAEVCLVRTDLRPLAQPVGEFDPGAGALALIFETCSAAGLGDLVAASLGTLTLAVLDLVHELA